MADVAAQAGVSVMTVSRVLNGFPASPTIPGSGSKKLSVARLPGQHSGTGAGRRSLADLGRDRGRDRTVRTLHMLFGIEAAAREAGHLLTFVTLSSSRATT